MLAVRTGVAVAALVAGTVAPQVTAVAEAQTDAPAQTQAQDQDQGRFQGDFMDALLDHLGLNQGDVISHVRTGGTIAELAEQNGSSGEEVVDVLLDIVDARLDEAIDSGQIDEDRAAEIRAEAEERITSMVFSTHDGPDGNSRPHRDGAQNLLKETVMEFLDVTEGDIVSHLRTGGTLAELAEENGSSGPELEAALVAAVQTRVDQAIADGQITEERGDEIVAEATEKINEIVYKVHEVPNGNPGVGNGEGKELVLDTVMEFLDVNQGEIVSHLRTGGTLAELAEENGSSGPELEAALVAAVQTRVDQAIADGQITEERGDEIVAEATEKISEIVYKVHTPGRSG